MKVTKEREMGDNIITLFSQGSYYTPNKNISRKRVLLDILLPFHVSAMDEKNLNNKTHTRFGSKG